MAVTELEHKLCPPCAPDGGYGGAEAGYTYRCPDCRASWSPECGLSPATSRFGNFVQRVKVRLTS